MRRRATEALLMALANAEALPGRTRHHASFGAIRAAQGAAPRCLAHGLGALVRFPAEGAHMSKNAPSSVTIQNLIPLAFQGIFDEREI
jgi:hypothetical protein